MAKPQEFEKIGEGTYDIYRPKKKKDEESFLEVIGGLFVVFLIMGIIGLIFG